MKYRRLVVFLTLVAACELSAAPAITPNPHMLWGKDTGIEVSAQADAVEKIVSRSNVAITDTWQVAVTEAYTNLGKKPSWLPAAGFYLGNGDAMVVAKDLVMENGKPAREKKGRWSFSVSPLDFWVGATHHSIVPVNEADLAKYKAEHPEKFAKGVAWWKEYKPPVPQINHQMSKGYIGNVTILIPELETCPDYRRAMDLYRATLVDTFRNGDKAVAMTTRVLRGSRAMATTVANTGKEPISVTVEVSTGQPYYPLALSEAKADGDVMWVRRNGKMLEVTNEVVCYGSLGVRVLGSAYTVSQTGKYAARTSAIKLAPGQSVTVLSEYDTSAVFPPNYFLPKIQAYIQNQTDDPVTPMLKRLRARGAADVETMSRAHLGWWRDFWGRSQIDIPSEPALEAHWYGRLYLLASQISVGRFPPGMAGFIDREKNTYFGDDYHLNGNFTAQFRGLQGVNHPEFLRAYTDFVVAQMPIFKADAAGLLLRPRMKEPGLPGINVTTATAPFGKVFAHDFGMHHNNADQAIPMIHLWETTRDEKYLRDVIYPYLKETALNWSSEFLLPLNTNNNRYVVNSLVGEAAKFQTNPSGAMAYILRVFQSAIEASTVLGVDADFRPGWQDRIERMSPFPTFTSTNGLTCLASAEGGANAYGGYTYNIFMPTEWFHRESREAEYFINLINNDGCFEPGAGHPGRWEWPWSPAVRAGYPWEKLMAAFREASTWVLPNYAFGYDGSLNEHIVVDGIVAMLMQSANGRITLFPNWNMKVDAAFSQLRGKDAFLVSSSVAGGVIGEVTILSEKGLPCRIENPWPGRKIKVLAGDAEVKVEPVPASLHTKTTDGKSPEIIEFKTKAGVIFTVHVEG